MCISWTCFVYIDMPCLLPCNKNPHLYKYIFQESQIQQEDQEKLENNGTGNMEAEDETSNVEDNDGVTSTKRTFTSPKTPHKKCKVNSSSAINVPIIEEALNLLKTIRSNKQKKKDEYELYGEQVAIKLRNITSPQARFTAQQIINITLFEAQMGKGVFFV